MDKVIIDGVDVSECEHYRAEIETKMPYGEYEIQKDKCHYSGIEVIQNCKGNKGCIYKQLKRLQAENFELKESLKVFQRPDITKILTLYKVGDIELLEQKCDRLQVENDNLKDDIDKQQLYVDSLEQENERLKEEKGGMQILIDNYIALTEKYHQALKEIRNIILSPEIIDEETKKLHTSEELDNIVRWHREDKLSKIQAKINEVIGEK